MAKRPTKSAFTYNLDLILFYLYFAAIMPHCLDNPTPLAINTVKFDGQNWEKAIAKYNSNNLKNGKKKIK